MSGFLERLVQRGQGGSQLSLLPVVRPMPAIYGASKSEGGAGLEQRDVEVPGGSPGTAHIVSPSDRSQPASLEADTSLLAPEPIAARRSRPPQDASSRISTGAPTAARASGERRSMPRVAEDREREAHADRPGHRAQTPQRSAIPPEADFAAPKGREAVPPLSEPGLEPARAVSPAPVRSGLERLFEAIEAADSAGVTTRPVGAWRADVPVAPTAEEAPVVSIGRITISVAPPPAAPAAAPTGPPRSHGFSAYARLRGGFER